MTPSPTPNWQSKSYNIEWVGVNPKNKGFKRLHEVTTPVVSMLKSHRKICSAMVKLLNMSMMYTSPTDMLYNKVCHISHFDLSRCWALVLPPTYKLYSMFVKWNLAVDRGCPSMLLFNKFVQWSIHVVHQVCGLQHYLRTCCSTIYATNEIVAQRTTHLVWFDSFYVHVSTMTAI